MRYLFCFLKEWSEDTLVRSVARATECSGERIHYDYAALGGIADKSVRAPINYADD
ncbi:MAG: hypothetical protein WBD27_15335 [Pyrinomonadaceae bacterium]